MKKRILAVLVSAAMIVADLPVYSMAADTAVAVETEAVETVEDGTVYDVDDVAVSDVMAKAQAQDNLPSFNGKKQTVTLLADVAADASENSIKLDPQKQVKKFLGGSFTNFKYESTNTSVATVDAAGVVKAKTAGTAKIKISADTTAKGKTKTVKATVKVVVKKKATKVTPAKEALFLENKYSVNKKGKVSAKAVTAKFGFNDKAVAKELAVYVAPEDMELIDVDASSNKIQGTGKVKISVKQQGGKLTTPKKINVGVYAWGNPDASANVVVVLGPKAAKKTKLEIGEVKDASTNAVIKAVGTKGAKATQFEMKVDASANAVIKADGKVVESKDIAWTSNNKSYVTVDADGNFKVVGIKTNKKGAKVATKVKVTAEYLGKKKAITVVVKP